LVGVDELRDVVVGVEAPAGRLDAVADHLRNGPALVAGCLADRRHLALHPLSSFPSCVAASSAADASPASPDCARAARRSISTAIASRWRLSECRTAYKPTTAGSSNSGTKRPRYSIRVAPSRRETA